MREGIYQGCVNSDIVCDRDEVKVCELSLAVDGDALANLGAAHTQVQAEQGGMPLKDAAATKLQQLVRKHAPASDAPLRLYCEHRYFPVQTLVSQPHRGT